MVSAHSGDAASVTLGDKPDVNNSDVSVSMVAERS